MKKLSRDSMAFDIMKIHIESQIKRTRITPFSRLLWCLGLNGWTRNFDLNMKDIINKSYEFADNVIKRRDDDKQSI